MTPNTPAPAGSEPAGAQPIPMTGGPHPTLPHRSANIRTSAQLAATHLLDIATAPDDELPSLVASAMTHLRAAETDLMTGALR